MLYFAYGSNLYPRQMRARCRGAQIVARGELHGWRLILTKRGTANIVQRKEAVVHGGLWKFHPHHVAAMDEWEGVAQGIYRRVWVHVCLADGSVKPALTYAGCARAQCSPGIGRPNYMLTAMIPGAIAFGLPEAYIESLRAWLPARPVAARRSYWGRRKPSRRMHGCVKDGGRF